MVSQVFISTFDNPFINLALESSLLSLWNPSSDWIYLWSHRPCIVLGRFQNPWQECHTRLMAKKEIPLLRRISGGGAVYHDRGNMCFSFFASNWSEHKEKNLQFLKTALKNLGITVEINSRYDLVCYKNKIPYKISGSAFKQKKDRALHHGTLLVNSDLIALRNYLNPPDQSLKTKALPSTPSPVVNLSSFKKDLTVPKVKSYLANAFLNDGQKKGEIVYIDQDFVQKHQDLYKKEYYRLTDWKWIYGETPEFVRSLYKNFSWGRIKLTLEGHRGIIKKALFEQNTKRTLHALSCSLEGKEYSPKGIEHAWQESSSHPRPTEVYQWLREAVE